MIRKIYSEEEKAKYVAGFKKCTLTLRDYAEKMQINHEDLRRWLKENYDRAFLFNLLEVLVYAK